MNFDYFTTAALKDELQAKLQGGRVQDVLQLDEFSLGLEVYAQQARHYLYLTAQPDQPHLRLVEGKLRKGVAQPAPLTLWLTRYVEGGKITAIRQPAWERILIFDLIHGEGAFSLILEPIERRANLILVADGLIKDSIRRVGADENRVRQLLPGYAYQPPPPQEKLPPQALTQSQLDEWLGQNPESKLHQIFTGRLHGFSPLLAKELAYRATGQALASAGQADPDAVWEVYHLLLTPLLAGQWQPGVVTEKDGPVAFAPYKITHRGQWQALGDMSAALNVFFGPLTGDQAYEAAKKPIRAQVQAAEKKLRGKLFSLKNQERDEAELLAYQTAGGWLLTYQHEIRKLQTEFQVPADQLPPDSPPLVIKLDPLLGPVENAQKYFEKYEKAKRSRASLPDMIQQTERDLRFLAQLDTDLDLATNWDEIGEVQDTLIKEGYWRGEKRRQTGGRQKSAPLRVVADNGMLIWVGKNSRQNEEVTFNKASPEDLWLHVRGMPGAHVVIKTASRPVPPEVLELAAGLAVYFSKGRTGGPAEVIVTHKKHVQKIKGAKQGMVKVVQQSFPSLRAAPLAPESE
jgi:predicted ribosome quality control (RQC) complex YloA/Tae2 family protein